MYTFRNIHILVIFSRTSDLAGPKEGVSYGKFSAEHDRTGPVPLGTRKLPEIVQYNRRNSENETN